MIRIIKNFICVIIILVGIFCSIRLYQDVTKTSYVNGTLGIENEFRKESFFYSSTAVAFSPTGDGDYYYFYHELPPVDNIDLSEKDYTFYFLDKPVINADMQGGQITAPISMNFYNVDGSVACNGAMNISIEFLSNTTKVKLYPVNSDSANYFEQHFIDYGLTLKLIETAKGK